MCILANVQSQSKGFTMTLCPIAVVVGCKKCPVFKICPVKRLIGDLPKTPEPEVQAKAATKTTPKPRTASSKKATSRKNSTAK